MTSGDFFPDRAKSTFTGFILKIASPATVWLGTCVLLVTVLALWNVNANQSVNLPRPDHIIIIIEENHSYSQIILDENAPDPYIKTLASEGASFTQSFAVMHHSQPNYLALFSGSPQGITGESCQSPSQSDSCLVKTLSTPNLGSELMGAHFTFRGYSEGLPSQGSTMCMDKARNYARKHNPWVNWQNDDPKAVNAVPSESNQPFDNYFPAEDFSLLPTVSIVVPNLIHDMHSGPNPIGSADTWLREKLDRYVQWAKEHNSLLIVTWDEDDCPQQGSTNQIPTVFVGPMVRPGNYSERIDHYRVLRTIEDMYKLPHAGNSGNVEPITTIWVSK